MSEQDELPLDGQKDDFAASLELAAEAKADENDPNDLNHSEADEKPEVAEQVEAKAEEPEVKAEEKEVAEDPAAELEQLRKTNETLGKRIKTLAKEKRDISTKLQETIKAVPAEPVEEGEQPQRDDFKTKAEFDVAVQAEAERRMAVADFNSKCNAVETAGSKAFGDKWAKAKADLSVLDDQGRIPMDILSVALETDDPARVLFVLGNDIEKATELMGMTPIKRAIAMDKIASSKPAERPQSKAPSPVEPLGGKGAGNDRPSDRDTDEEWNRKEAIRERQVAEARRKARGY